MKHLLVVTSVIALTAGGCTSDDTDEPPPPAGATVNAPGVPAGPAAGTAGVPVVLPAVPAPSTVPAPVADPPRFGDFLLRVVSVGLANPWEVTWGPDDYLWITERTGKAVARVRPSDGARVTALELPEVYQGGGQDGVLGMALHPRLLTGTGEDYVYVAFTYDAAAGNDVSAGFTDAGAGTESSADLGDAGTGTALGPGDAAAGNEPIIDARVALRRYEYDVVTQRLGRPVTLLSGLPASSDHNSGRLAFGPDDKLYYTIGDQGANQFLNKCHPNRAQDLPTAEQVEARDWSLYRGKVLRIGLDGSIPTDNPVLADVRSHVFSYGHRNAQGISFGASGTLYASEHGPKSDDELNIIRGGQNYGWPHVAGYQDDQAYVYANWSLAPDCETLTFDDYVIPPSVPSATESSWPGPFVSPIKTLYTVANDYNFHDPACAGSEYICWPTVAPSSLDVYTQQPSGIPGWADSLLVVSLKRGAVLRFKLLPDGQSVEAESQELFRTINRYRDIAQAPNGRDFYVVTDSTGQTSGPTQGFTGELDNPGALLEFSYAPATGTASVGERAP